jgi:Subtilase family
LAAAAACGTIANMEADMTVTNQGSEYSAGTVDHGARDTELFASGKKSGHGTIAWLPAPSYDIPDPPPWQQPGQAAAGRPPVIALLDSGVQQHDWLPDPASSTPFLLDAAQEYGWQAPELDDDDPPATGLPGPDYGSHSGHATFIAGLLRLAAPGAQVLSMRVMNNAGKVRESDVAGALNWLADHPKAAGGIDIDIVLMAFGRQADPADKDLDNLRAPIGRLSQRGVRIVASAGNDGAELPVYPAAFAVEPPPADGPKLSVLSVGALATPTERAPYSNSGPWVLEWGNGTNVISIMPLTTKDTGKDEPVTPSDFDPFAAPATGNGYAWWSGTSFAAATAAGLLAAQLPGGQALPEPTAGP